MDLFHENLKIWLLKNPEYKKSVESLEALPKPFSVSVCETVSGLANLKLQIKKDQGSTVYLHSRNDPAAEANEWFASLDLAHVQTIYVYGIGLGYYYDAAVEWLNADKERYLVFLEDDAEVMHCFFETERCAKLLENPQVVMMLLGERKEQVMQFTKITSLFNGMNHIFTGLNTYHQVKSPLYSEFKSTVSFMTTMSSMLYSESVTHGLAFFRNFFLNFLDLPGSFFGNGLTGKFEGVPAIICGAGPSLNKNIEVLATLYDKALIFAGGTALNALNGKGIMPHFGVGIDPNPDQFTRLIMNNAFELPFLYRCRMLHEAIKMIHGDRLYMTGSGGYEIAKWFENQLGVDEQHLQEGFNVLNFSVMIAHAMGCNPIICVGVDLAYSEGDSYASGVISHPMHSRQGNFRTKHMDDEIISKNDIHGKQVFTLWKWIAESMWYTHFSDSHPQITLINATEGGIGFPNVANLTLAEVKEKYLTKQFDLKTRLHGEIQNSPLPETFNGDKITSNVKTLTDSLAKCGELCQNLITYLSDGIRKNEIHESFFETMGTQEEELHQETAYEVVVKRFNDDFFRRRERDFKRRDRDKSKLTEKEYLHKKASLELERYQSLKETCMLNAALVYDILEKHKLALGHRQTEHAKNRQVIEALRLKYPLPLPNPKDEYLFVNETLKIIDRDVPFECIEEYKNGVAPVKESILYSSGKIKLENYYLNNILHGPSTYYAENGKVLSSSWYVAGKLEGKVWAYHPDGSLHSFGLFGKGLPIGTHQYFYPDWIPKSMISFSKGKFHGEVRLFSLEGFLLRQLSFLEGKRSGNEQIWNHEGHLLIDCNFEADRPVGVTKVWHPNGMLAKEIIYDNESRRIGEKEWDLDGELIQTDESKNEDYFDLVSKETDKLTASLGDMVARMAVITPLISDKYKFSSTLKEGTLVQQNELSDDLVKLQKEMQNLQELDGKLREQLFGKSEDAQEAIWKTPASRREMEKQFESMREKINSELGNIQKGIHTVVDSLTNKDKDKDIEEKKK